MDLQQEQAQLFQVGKTELMKTAAVCSIESDSQQRPTRACLKNQPSKKTLPKNLKYLQINGSNFILMD